MGIQGPIKSPAINPIIQDASQEKVAGQAPKETVQKKATDETDALITGIFETIKTLKHAPPKSK